jgi:DNA polymerase-1
MPHVRRWKEALELQIRRTGQVHSLLGRIRRTELHRHSNRTVVEGAIRSMINTQIQGSAADIINSAMVHTHYNEDFKRSGARICLQVHDELLTNCPAATAERAMQIKSFYMRNPFPDFHLKVPLIVEGGVSNRWSH